MAASRTVYWLEHVAKPLLFVLSLLPFAYLAWGVYADRLGANPVEVLTRETGQWTLRFLLLSLAVTPLRRLSGWHWLVRLRRMLGLYAFFYASVHLLLYLWLDQFFYWQEIGRDILERPFILMGMLAYLLLLPLAATSTNAMMRRLGGKRWQRLHRLVYASAVAALIHFLWLVKADLREPLIYTGIFLLLMLLRLRKKPLAAFLPRPSRR